MARKVFKDSHGRNLREGERQKPDGRYEYRYLDIYKKTRSVYSWRLTKADPQPKGKKPCKCLRELEEEISKDKHDGIDTSASKSVTLNERFGKYMKTKIKLKPSTKQNYNYMYDHCVRNSLGLLKIGAINASDVKSFYTSLVIDKGFQPSTVENVHTLLNPVFAAAVEDNIIRTNPCTKAIKDIRETVDEDEETEITGMSCSEQRAFVDFMLSQKCFANWANVITILLGAGLRISELRGLTWDDISFEGEGSINVNHQLLYKKWEDGKCYDRVVSTKRTASERVIPMQPKVKEAFLAERERQRYLPNRNIIIDGYSNWVFLNRQGLVLKPNNCNDALARIVSAYNIEEEQRAKSQKRKAVLLPHLTNHSLRHTYCTRMIERCIGEDSQLNIKIVQYLMGHRDAKTTLNIYAHVHEEYVKNTMSKFAGQIYLG